MDTVKATDTVMDTASLVRGGGGQCPPPSALHTHTRALTHDCAVHIVCDRPRLVVGAKHHDLGRGAGGGGTGHPGEHKRACEEKVGQKVSEWVLVEGRGQRVPGACGR